MTAAPIASRSPLRLKPATPEPPWTTSATPISDTPSASQCVAPHALVAEGRREGGSEGGRRAEQECDVGRGGVVERVVERELVQEDAGRAGQTTTRARRGGRRPGRPRGTRTTAAMASPAAEKRRPEKASGFQRSNAYLVVA